MNKKFIEFMIASDVLRFGEFKTNSGRMSPYFINAGLYNTGEQINALGEYYADLVYSDIGGNFDVMFGPAYKGIPLVCSTAAALHRKYGINKPYCFNRKEIKDHGEGGIMVGHKLSDGDRVIIIEDILTSGRALQSSMDVLKSEADVVVKDMFISADRMEKGMAEDSGKSAVDEAQEKYGIKIHAITNVIDIFEYIKSSVGSNGIDGTSIERTREYMDKYCMVKNNYS